MPSRNAEKTLLLAVRSTLLAMSRDDELIVGLHACTDSSEVLLEAVNDSRLTVVTFEGGSLSAVLNALIKRASGEFIARMDSDDICLPWRFSIQIPFLKSRAGSIVFSTSFVSWPVMGGKGQLVVPQLPTRLSAKVISFLLPYQCPVMQPTMIAEAETLLKLDGYRSVGGEDWDLWLRADRQGIPMIRSALPALVYRISPQQLSRNETYLAAIERDPVIRKHRLEGADASAKRFQELSSLERVLSKIHVFGLFNARSFTTGNLPDFLAKNLFDS